ncbi:MAG: FlgD immunoglobulin-like domain containing protein [Candidatus Krumholzibacteriia bacterium]
MSRRIALFLAPLLAAACLPAHARAQGIIANLQVDKFTFSPNGDGVTDSATVTYTLSDTAAVYVLIVQSDSVTVVDTLVAGVVHNPQDTPASVTWDGRSQGGPVVADGRYVVFMKAQNASAADSAYLSVAVDLTPPQVTIVNVSPATPFAPNAPGQPTPLKIDFVLRDAPPSTSVFASVSIFDPSASVIQTVVNSDQPLDTTLQAQWDGTGTTTDGQYEARVVATDQAGQTATTFTAITVDLDDPDLAITSLPADQHLQAIPDSLFGWAWDRNGIDSVFVRYSGGVAAFEPVASTKLVTDTLFFAVQLVDSLTADGTYAMGFKAVDRVARERIIPFAITLDRSAPPVPTLVQPASPTRKPRFLLDVTQSPVPGEWNVMRIFRNGAFLDSVFPNLPNAGLPYDAALLPGANRFTAVAVDQAGNGSAASNEITIVFDSAAGLSMPQPFVANDDFQINLTKPALTVTVKIYDLGGHLVEELSSSIVSTSVTISWDGLNGDSDPVEKGPLVAVARAHYLDGDREVFREIFLFQP